ncbi:sensor histidine kinase [Deinococcus hopiensis]|uniref:histidine kinase n=1 Tax=Deinococcus hopiensis KR-140 TaxID=695939 RepID=A0A1W1VT70_9DEIO|nr:HAMP domain-containing sensor histidine kinase [Deinococcus hopiensis]SMB96301.1 Signal transduction histidine kinase [Deinococcus hopiensis KR-140]
MIRSAPLHTARVAWRHSLRFRLALTYTLVALLLIGMIGAGVMTLLLRSMDRQFQARLGDRAEAVAERLTTPQLGLRQKSPPTSGYTAILDEQGRVVTAAAGLGLENGEPFPYSGQTQPEVRGTPMRAVTRAAGTFTVWVALPTDDLVVARQSATRALLFALLLTPALMLVIGWWVGRKALANLEEAADLADRIDPTRSLATLPLPVQEDEVHRLLAALNRLLVRIEAVQSREKQLLGQIVHELGAPLTVLKASLTRAGDRTGDAEVLRAALVADELTFTTQDLMQLARGQLEMRLAWHFIPATTLRSRLDRLVPGTTFAGHWDGMLLCDPDRLTQALRNLLANARRAAGPEGNVTLTLEESAEHITFRVRDTGPGLPPELGDQIFEPFVSGSGSSGLGLSVSRQIATMHGGTLTAGNAPGGGAQFCLTIPGAALGEEDEEAEETVSASA